MSVCQECGNDAPAEGHVVCLDCLEGYSVTYRRKAAMTTAVTVVPSRLAFATATLQSSAGMRMDRGMVGISGPDHIRRGGDATQVVPRRPIHQVGVSLGFRPSGERPPVKHWVGVEQDGPSDRGPEKGRVASVPNDGAARPSSSRRAGHAIGQGVSVSRCAVPAGCRHRSLRSSVCIYSLRPAVSTRQEVSRTSFEVAA